MDPTPEQNAYVVKVFNFNPLAQQAAGAGAAPVDVLDPKVMQAAAAKVVAQANECDEWLATYLKGSGLRSDPTDPEGARVIFNDKPVDLKAAAATTVAASRQADLKQGGADLMTADRVNRAIAEILAAQAAAKSGGGSKGPDPANLSIYLQYTFTPITTHTPVGGGAGTADQPAQSLTGQVTFEYHGPDESGLEVSVLGQATLFADDKGGRLQMQSGFTGAQVAWVWTFLNGAFQAGPQFQALIGAARAQNKLDGRVDWTPTGQVSAGGQVQYAIPGLGGHVLVGIQAGVSATDSKGADATFDKTAGFTLTYKF